jgi:UDP-N-acetylmuramoyl-L-alanyl-D-glutamate--2,6-diaminopimelate ligase
MSTRVLREAAKQAIGSRPVGAFPVRTLRELIADLPGAEVSGDDRAEIRGLSYRSSDARDGFVFFCVPGSTRDGHDFAAEAVDAGAVALVVERPLPGLRATQVLVPSVRAAMGPVSAAFYGRPADAMTVVGVTGTNGKTTTTYLLEAVFRASGRTPGVLGTTGVRIDGRPAPFPRTTPEAPDLHRLFAEMAESGVDAVAMEVSSHGLDQHRVDGVRFDCAVFTNLSQDHLDYHPSMEAYFAAKARLFTSGMSERAVLNHDSEHGRRLMGCGVPVLTYGIDEGADVRATSVRTSAEGIAFAVDGTQIRSRLRGRFNVENALAALATARSLGIPDALAAEAIESVGEVPGRVEPVETGRGFLVTVDYAHTPDSVENVLRAMRPLATGRLIAVLGCGGDRDRGKRPDMGRAATSNADLSILTSDNPRSEDPLAIIAEIEPGARLGGGAYLVEPDRRAAIHLAISEAAEGDVVVIAGKGHETYQELASRTIPFDDREVVADALRAIQEPA